VSDHSRAFVPVDTGLCSSPELIEQNRSVDIGLIAEALLYYEQVLVSVANKHQFAELISRLIQQGLSFPQLIELIRENTIQIYNYAFYTLPFVRDNIVQLWNIQDPIMERPNSFSERFLDDENLNRCLFDARQMNEFRESLNGKVIEVKASEFGASGIDNAWRDFLTPRRSELIVQALLDELYNLKALGPPPKVKATVHRSVASENLQHTTWNINFDELSKLMGPKLVLGPTVPLSAAVIGNRSIWSARSLNCDLYLPQPLSVIVGDKLLEAEQVAAKTRDVIDQLKAEVDFPNVRRLVNEGHLDFNNVLEIRKKAKRFRQWLQTEGQRDHSAIIAYHEEVARETGIIKFGRKALNLFGVLGGSAVGGMIGAKTKDPVSGATIGGAVGSALTYVFDLGSKLGTDWKPVVFGNWFKDRIEKLLEDQSANG
jgi:hypothetical protein